MPKITTLKKRSDFVRISARCHKSVMPAFILQVADNPEPQEGLIRVGYTASRRVGNAVIRNRAKRRLRELVRELFPDFADSQHDYVLIARHSTASRDFTRMRDELIGALKKDMPK